MISELAFKLAFAAQLLKNGNAPNEAFKAALIIFPDDTSLALKAATQWVNDPIVIAEKLRLGDGLSDEEKLPSKAELLKEIHDKAKGTVFAEDYAKLMRLYMEVRGMISKPALSTNVNLIQNKVMIVKNHGNDSDWNEGLKAQQARLINASAT
jgi:hypothetical protein